MDYFLRFAQPLFFVIGLLALILGLLFRLWFKRSPIYYYPIASMLNNAGLAGHDTHSKKFFGLCVW